MSLKTFVIPVVSTPQTFSIELSGATYIFTCKWNNQPDAGWTLDISDANNIPIVSNIPLITGDNLLDGLDYLGFQGTLIVNTNGSSPFDVPTFTNLGIDSFLYYQTGAA